MRASALIRFTGAGLYFATSTTLSGPGRARANNAAPAAIIVGVDSLALNNREIAALIWIGIVFLLALRKGAGPALLNLGRSLLNPRLGLPLIALVAYVAAVLLALSELDLWGFGLLPYAVVWLLAVGLPLWFAAGTQNPTALRRGLGAALSLTVAVEVFVNLAVAPLLVELVALPVITVLILVPLVAQGHPESAPAVGPAEWLVSLLGLAAIVFVIVSIATNWEGFDKLQAVRELLLPIILTVALLPFLRGLWAYSG